MNPMDLLKNLQSFQSKLSDAKGKLGELRASGSAGGDMVRVELNGEFQVLKVEIAPDAVDPDDIEMLQDLIVAAHRDAFNKLKDLIQQEMSSLTGGLNIPPDLMNG